MILAGDAAHCFPPAGGFGMNTGIQVGPSLRSSLPLACVTTSSADRKGRQCIAADFGHLCPCKAGDFVRLLFTG